MPPYRLVLEVSRLPGLQAAGTTGTHWAVRRKEQKWWREMIASVSHGQRPKAPLERCKVKITRKSTRAPDVDNLYASSKFVLDAIVSARIARSDAPDCMKLECTWERAARGKGGVRIEVSEA